MSNWSGFVSDISSFISSAVALYIMLMMSPIPWLLVISTIVAILAIIAKAKTDYDNSPTRLAATILPFLAVVLRVGGFYTIGVAQSPVSSFTDTSFQGLIIIAAILDIVAYPIARAALKARGPKTSPPSTASRP